MDLLSLALTLKPLETRPAAETPKWWGRAAHGLFLNLVQARDAGLSAQLHDEAGLRPFTTSTLMGHFERGALMPSERYVLRLTALRADLVNLLLEETASGSLRSGQTLQLDYIPFEVLSAQSESRSPQAEWAAVTSFQDLSAPHLLVKQEPPRRLAMLFASPTTFKSGGKHVPLPLPGLVFGSLLERWNAFAPVAFPDEVRRYAEECLALSQYDLETRPVPMKSGGLRVGAVGKAAFASLNYDRYWMSLVSALADFSLFAGVGAGTTAGLGQCRRIAEMRSNSISQS